MLTGGGDCPGLNAVIRAVVRKGERYYGDELIGFLDAWDGVRRAAHACRSTVETMRGTLPRGGTVLGTKRGSPFDRAGGVDEVHGDARRPGPRRADRRSAATARSRVACRLHAEDGLPIVGVPKTIDNDIVGTDVTFGFNTAVQIATDAIDRLHTTAESHDRVMVVEVMGRHSGWIATYAGIAGGATVVLIPEIPFDIEEVCDRISAGATSAAATPRSSSSPRAPSRRRARSTSATQVYDQFGHVRLGGIADVDRPTRSGTAPASRPGSCMLGHVQRGGTPTAFDRVLSTRFGVAADRRRARRRLGPDGRARGRDRAAPLDCRRQTGRSTDAVHDVAEIFFALTASTVASAVSPTTSADDRLVVALSRLAWSGAGDGHRRGTGGWADCGEPGEVVDGQRRRSAARRRRRATRGCSPSTRMRHRLDAVELAGREHDLGDGELQRPAGELVELVADSRRSSDAAVERAEQQLQCPAGIAVSQPRRSAPRSFGPCEQRPDQRLVGRVGTSRSTERRRPASPVARRRAGRCARSRRPRRRRPATAIDDPGAVGRRGRRAARCRAGCRSRRHGDDARRRPASSGRRLMPAPRRRSARSASSIGSRRAARRRSGRPARRRGGPRPTPGRRAGGRARRRAPGRGRRRRCRCAGPASPPRAKRSKISARSSTGHARAVVLDGDLHVGQRLVVGVGVGDRDLGLAAAVGAGVVDEVGDDAGQPPAVAADDRPLGALA